MNGQTLTCTVHILPLDNFTTKHSLCSNTIICVSVNTEVNTYLNETEHCTERLAAA